MRIKLVGEQKKRLQDTVNRCITCLIKEHTVLDQTSNAEGSGLILQYKDENITIQYALANRFDQKTYPITSAMSVWEKDALVLSLTGAAKSGIPDMNVGEYIPGDWETKIPT